MAKPRIFVSSTFYDLRTIRDDLDRFIRGMGFEPIRHEKGHIAYGVEDKPELYAYREIEFCDILVCIIGGRYGTNSIEGHYSITQKELKSAIEKGKQVYIFIDDAVHHEHRLYTANKSIAGIKYTAVDNIKIHEFLEEIYALPKGNPIFQFSVSSDITLMLSEQWAGLFQRLLSEHSKKPQSVLLDELQRSLQTVGQLVEFLTEEKGKGDSAVQSILLSNHPIFQSLRVALKNRYRIYFTNYTELGEWLTVAKNFIEETEWQLDEAYYEWERPLIGIKKSKQTLQISKHLFGENGELISMTQAQWNDDWVRVTLSPSSTVEASKPVDDNDIPF